VEPDSFLVLDIPAAVAEERRTNRGGADDTYEHRYEQEDISFHDRVNKGYAETAERLGLVTIDASVTFEEVHEAIWSNVQILIND
jgi:thymidylate kinase